MARVILLILVGLITGCSKYERVGNSYYKTSHEAVVAFYKQHRNLIRSSGRGEEILGWVLKCEEGYGYTNAIVGDLSNPVRPQEVDKGSCSLRAFIHTHPRTQGTVDFFSKSDMKIGKWRGIYLLSLENNHVRFHNGTQDRNGILLGILK